MHQVSTPVRKVTRTLFVESPKPAPGIGHVEVSHAVECEEGVQPPKKSKSADDEEWCRDIWRSYGTYEAQLPSPIGFSRSPSAIFGDVVVVSTTPASQWSLSSDDMPWGPDSAVTPLEENTQPLIPN